MADCPTSIAVTSRAGRSTMCLYWYWYCTDSVSRFLMLFRFFAPELCSYFEDQELSPNEWLISWLQVRHTQIHKKCALSVCVVECARHARIERAPSLGLTCSVVFRCWQFLPQSLLASDLPVSCLLRLWDTYLSCADG